MAWYLLNALDVHSTLKGMKYSCVVEANPILPAVPHRDNLLIHKSIILSSFFNLNQWAEEEIWVMNFVMASAVINNYKIVNRIKKNPDTCPKR